MFKNWICDNCSLSEESLCTEKQLKLKAQSESTKAIFSIDFNLMKDLNE